MGDEALFQSILQQFREETEADLQRLNDNLKNPQANIIREIVHKLAGRVGQMGAAALSADLHDIESEIIEGTPINSLIQDVIEAKEGVRKLIDSVRLSTLHSN